MKTKANIAEEFNEFSRNYTEDMVKCVPFYPELLVSFTDNLPTEFLPTNILDLGCGNGNVTNALLELFPDAKYTLVDASEDMLTICKQRFSNYNINNIHSYFNDFNFEVNNFDIVTAGFSLHHCKASDKLSLYKAIFCALKNNGVFLCSDLMINKHGQEHEQHLVKWRNFVLNNYPSEEKWSWLMEHYNQFDNPNSIEQHIRWLKLAGFERFDFAVYGKYWTHFKAFKK